MADPITKHKTLTDILAQDARTALDISQVFVKSFAGGLYYPFLVGTSLRRLDHYIKEGNLLGTHIMGQCMGAAVTMGGGIYLSQSQGYTGEFLGLLAATNIVDYVVHVHRRARQSRE